MAKNKQPIISIITVCFNESKERVALTFDSISSQSYKNTEWIVIDGGSEPETIQAINGYLTGIEKFVSEPDNGIYDAMNKGLAIASGDYVVFMNVGDRFYCSETVESVVDFILANPAYDCYYGDPIVLDKDGKEWAAPQLRRINRYNLRYSMICHQSIFARKSIFKATGSFDTSYRLIADKVWVLKSINAGAKWAFMDIFICYYDMTGVSADVIKRGIEIKRFVANNYCAIENVMCFFLRKYRNMRQRFTRNILKCSYKGLPLYIAK